MIDKRKSIDIQRDGAINIKIGDDDDASPAKEVLSLGDSLYVFKARGVYKVSLADQIDPERTNPNIPNVNQQVLTKGYDSEVVGRVLLTAKALFYRNADKQEEGAVELIEGCIDLTRHIIELQEMVAELDDKILGSCAAFENAERKRDSLLLPSIPSLDKDIHNILVKTDKVRDGILNLYRIYFFPRAQKKPSLSEYDNAIEESLKPHTDLIEMWSKVSGAFSFIRDIRNASVHRKEGQQVVVQNFKMNINGEVLPPMIEVEHKNSPLGPIKVVEFVNSLVNLALDLAEGSIVLIKRSSLLKHNPLNELVVSLSSTNKQNQSVRYCRAIKHNGQIMPLG